MRLVLSAAIILVIWLIAGPYVVTSNRLFDSETRLAIGETRIGGITNEMMRRTPNLEATFQEFVTCGPKCDSWPSIFAKRDAIVKDVWPAIFDRLAIRKDWGSERETRISRDTFFDELGKRGPLTLRDQCVPKIEYVWPVHGRNPEPMIRLGGFVCPPSPRPG